MTRLFLLLLLLSGAIAQAQTSQSVVVSAFETSGDSTVLFPLSAPAVLHDIIVIIDTAWARSDSLKIGTAGYTSQRPANLLSTDSSGRAVASGRRAYIGQSIALLGGSIVLYHPNATASTTGRIIVHVRWTDIAAPRGSVTATTLE